jgi:hypothetical protein
MPKKLIKELDKDTWQRVYAAREEWRRFGLCTEPADRPTTEAVISDFYRRLGKEPPKFIWFDGPLAACVLSPIVMMFLGQAEQLRSQLDSQLYSQLRSQLRSQLSSQLYSQLSSQLDSQLSSQLDSQLDSQLYSQLRSQLYSQLSSQLDSQLYSQLDDLARKVFQVRWGGGEWCTWIAWFSVLRDVVGVEYPPVENELLMQWERLARASGWWFVTEKFCFCADRHKTIRFDEARRLHSPSAPAIECRDGLQIFAWHGTTVPREWIEAPKSIDPKLALTWKNVEQRRALAEIIGWKVILEQLQLKVIDRDPDPQIGTLLEVDLPDSPGERFLQVKCGTGRDFVLCVPKQYRTALEANAATYNVPPDVLRQIEVRT